MGLGVKGSGFRGIGVVELEEFRILMSGFVIGVQDPGRKLMFR